MAAKTGIGEQVMATFKAKPVQSLKDIKTFLKSHSLGGITSTISNLVLRRKELKRIRKKDTGEIFFSPTNLPVSQGFESLGHTRLREPRNYGPRTDNAPRNSRKVSNANVGVLVALEVGSNGTITCSEEEARAVYYKLHRLFGGR